LGVKEIMTTLADVYCKFGEASEAAQLLETELGNLLLKNGIEVEDLAGNQNSERATQLFKAVNRQTLGQLLSNTKKSTASLAQLESVLSVAHSERNRLAHSFYRQHNFRRNGADGRAVMLKDLEAIHNALLTAYKAVMLLSGIDLDAIAFDKLPANHVPI
jgi:hypothetical protein